jgi:hypothetical protein
MPFDFSVDHVRRRVNIIASDPLSVDDVLAVLDRQAAQGWTYAVLHDATGTKWVPSAGEVVRILGYIRTTSRRLGKPRGPVAFVASNEELFGMARMYSRLGADDHLLKVQVFTDRVKAENWLDEGQSHDRETD